MKMKSIKAIFRRGQVGKIDPVQGQAEDVLESSSSNGASLENRSKGALSKSKKSSSKDKLDKIAEKRNDKKGKLNF